MKLTAVFYIAVLGKQLTSGLTCLAVEEELKYYIRIKEGSHTPYFSSKAQTDDNEIKFLQYYKILEYISPLVAKLNAYDKLNKRLDLLASSTRDYKYLDSIFSVTRKYDLDVKDDYLAESVIKTCVDICYQK